jgi:hypothetical protein
MSSSTTSKSVMVRVQRKRIDRRSVAGREVTALYRKRGADACIAVCKKYGVTKRAMLLTLAAIEYRR